jgi:hypothetical protein
MAKISLRHSAAQAYGLLLGRPLTVIGLTWLPAAFYGVACNALIGRIDTALAGGAHGLYGEYTLLCFLALLAATALFGSVIAVPLTRQALGLREGMVIAHLVIGARELRMFFALLFYYGLLAASLALLAVAAGVAITQGLPYAAAHNVPAAVEGIPLELWLDAAAWTLAAVWTLYLVARFGFLLDAVAGCESHTRLGRAAALSRGSFWTIVAALAVATLPATVTLIACEMTFGGLSSHGASASIVFSAILTAGLVVLHALMAGASAGAYASATEETTEVEHATEEEHGYYQPAPVFAHFRSADAERAVAAMPEAVAMGQVAAPCAVAAIAAAVAPTVVTHGAELGWVPPPPAAHYGTDGHDDAALSETAASQPETMPAVEDVPQTGPADEAQLADLPPDPFAAPGGSSVEAQLIPGEAAGQGAAPAAIVEAHPADFSPLTEPDTIAAAMAVPAGLAVMTASAPPANTKLEDASAWPVTGIPDHALNAEFPAPPLDPAGAMSSQAGFYSAG